MTAAQLRMLPEAPCDVSPELRAAAGLDRQVLLIGMGNHLELWDVQRHAAAEAALLQQPMPASLQDFSF